MDRVMSSMTKENWQNNLQKMDIYGDAEFQWIEFGLRTE